MMYLYASNQCYDAEQTINMSYATEAIAASLKEARTAKGLSQRDLSVMAGVPQAQISRIEASTVDPRTTSLIALAHALDMELSLVPRKAVPAVKSISRQSVGQKSKSTGMVAKEMNRIAETLRSVQVSMPALEGITHLQKNLADVERFRLQNIDPDLLRKLRKTIDQIQLPSHSLEAIARSQDVLKSLSNQLAHAPITARMDDRPRPAYSLDEDDDA
jgi:transcriptional regulator with XRE-family HTH domain